MPQKKANNNYCNYGDSLYHYENCNWQYADSLREWASAYKDSVVVDYEYSTETGPKAIYVHKGDSESWKGRQEDKQDVTFATTAQYYMVPTFFAIMIILTVFAIVLYRDNDKALKQKRKDSVLGFISKEKDDIYIK